MAALPTLNGHPYDPRVGALPSHPTGDAQLAGHRWIEAYADEDRISFAPTMAVGTWTVDPEPRMRTADGHPADTPGCVVVNPGDAIGLEVHPDSRRSSGCCGHDGCDWPNRRCSRCQAEVATLSDDCWTVVEVRFEPAAVRVVPAQ